MDTLKQWDGLYKLYNICYRKNHIRVGKSNELNYSKALFRGLSIEITGINNLINIQEGTRIANSRIIIRGNNNLISIGKDCVINEGLFWCENDGNCINLKDNVTTGKAEFAAIEGTKLVLEEDCMLSSNISLRTGDSHSIVDMDGRRTNYSQDIHIGRHVWIGEGAVILKGVTIGDNCVIGTKSLVNKSFEKSNCIIGGVPGTILKHDTDWKRERI